MTIRWLETTGSSREPGFNPDIGLVCVFTRVRNQFYAKAISPSGSCSYKLQKSMAKTKDFMNGIIFLGHILTAISVVYG